MTSLAKWDPLVSLVRWDPFRELEYMFGDVHDNPKVVRPALDVYETDTEMIVELEVPGYDEKELDIEFIDHTLIISGEHKSATDKKERSYHLRERSTMKFIRRIPLPEMVDTENLTATFKKGVLKLTAPKTQIAPPKKIPIEG